MKANSFQFNKILDYILLFTSLIIINGTIIYYLYALNTIGVFITIILSLTLFYFIYPKIIKKNTISQTNLEKTGKTLLISYLILFIISIIYLFTQQSVQSLASPWEVVNKIFFVLYFILTLNLLISFYHKIPLPIKLTLISLHFFLSFIIATIIYKLSYGFDPIIHEASMEFINKFGFILPKTPYYIGEYSLIIILHKISFLPISFWNKILVPLLASVFIPQSIYQFLSLHFKKKYNILTTIIFLLILTFSPFISTTPQNLSYIFLILTIFKIIQKEYLWSNILALSTLAIHPLTGIPIIILSIYITIKQYKKINNIKLYYFSLFIINSLSIPLALLLSNHNQFQKNLSTFTSFIKNYQNIGMAGQENVILNFIYFFCNNLPIIITLIIISSIIIAYKHKFRSPLLLTTISSLLLSYFFSQQIKFNNVINYEQSSYSQRILILIILFSLPYIAFSMQIMINKALRQEKYVKLIYLLITSLLITTSLYISYPRVDKYVHSKGFSISIDDINTVHWIENNNKNKYIVLSNQQTGVAALKEFGFNHYYPSPDGPLYFYSIPTGSQLYKYYLKMVQKTPTKKTAIKAMNLVGIHDLYLVINKYWYKSDRLIGEAKLNANDYQQINDNYIFHYSY